MDLDFISKVWFKKTKPKTCYSQIIDIEKTPKFYSLLMSHNIEKQNMIKLWSVCVGVWESVCVL